MAEQGLFKCELLLIVVCTAAEHRGSSWSHGLQAQTYIHRSSSLPQSLQSKEKQMLMQKVTAGNRPAAVSVQAECLSYQVTHAGREKHHGGSRVCKRKQVKYIADLCK